MRIILALIFVFSLISCSSEDENAVCVSFDTRQCMGDPWTEEVDTNASAEVQSEQLKTYFESNGIDVKKVTADLTFHQVVCEACFVCPEGPRFYVEAEEDEAEKLKALDLLNYTLDVCPE